MGSGSFSEKGSIRGEDAIMSDKRVVSHHDILKWAGEVLDLIAKHTDSNVIIGKVLGVANEARRGELYSPPTPASSECHLDQPE